MWALYTLLDKLLDKPEPITEKAKWRVVMTDPGPGRWIDNGLDIITSDPGPVRVTANDDSLIRISGDVLFDTGRATLKPGADRTIDRLAQALKDNPNTKVQIEGHTDSVGGDDYNLALSERRAEAVADALRFRGVPADRYEAKGLGKDFPVASNDSAAGRQQNRRVEIIFSDDSGRFSGGTRTSSSR